MKDVDGDSQLQLPAIPPELDPSVNGVLPPWILLDTSVYLAHHRHNSTTVNALTSSGHAIQLTICLAHPPAVSYVCIDCPDISQAKFAGLPRLVRSEKQFLLLYLPLHWSSTDEYYQQGQDRPDGEYYVYHAVPGKPSLCRIPNPAAPSSSLSPDDLGIYCCGEDEGYILAGLCWPSSSVHNFDDRELHLYSSTSRAWTVQHARLETPPNEEHLPFLVHKVIPLGGGSLLGWVDLSKGMVVCDVLLSHHHHHPHHHVPLGFIPLPDLMPQNKQEEDYHLCPRPWYSRDVTCCADGSLKFVEIEHFRIPDPVVETPCDDPDVVYDDRCFVRPPEPEDPDKKWWPRSLFGWRAVIWNRARFDNCWRKGGEVHVDDIVVQNPHHSALLAQLGDDAVGDKAIMNLLPSFPTLGVYGGDDVVHMSSSVRSSDINTRRMISVDMSTKMLKTLAPCPVPTTDRFCGFFPCVLSSYLGNSTPIIQAQQTPQKSFGDYGRPHGYATSCTYPSYGNNQHSLPVQLQPKYQPNWPVDTDAFGRRMAHPHPMNDWLPYHPPPPWAPMPLQPFSTMLPQPLSAGNYVLGRSHRNTDAFRQMVHPHMLNECRQFQPPPQWAHLPPPPFTMMLPPLPLAAAVNPTPVNNRNRNPHRHSPYGRPRQNLNTSYTS